MMISTFFSFLSFTPKPKEHYSAAVLIEMKKGGKTFTCSGVAFDHKTVLTSAHCMDGADEVKVILDPVYSLRPKTFLKVDYFVNHESYNPKKSFYHNDISLLFLEKKLPDSVVLNPIRKVDFSRPLERVGFGGRKKKNQKNILKVTPYPHHYNQNKKYLKFKDADAVVGDSGGPIFMKEKKQVFLVGLHSTYENDHKTFSVHLWPYYNWILHQVNAHSQVTQIAN